MNIIGVSRGSIFSPNHIDNDAAIFQAVVENLRLAGHQVSTYTEEEFVNQEICGAYIFQMVRSQAAIRRLLLLEQEGSRIVNAPQGVLNCIRKPMTELLLQHGIAYPPSFILPTDQSFSVKNFPCWIKRGDAHAMIKSDVVFVETKEEADKVLKEFHTRGIPEAVVNLHLVGDLIKFYGVAGTDFFYTFYPTEQSHSKFGLEAINGESRGYPFNKQTLQELATEAAHILRVPIYGGDCVVAEDGSIHIIDFNDWPSFARCREEAAKAIAEGILKELALI